MGRAIITINDLGEFNMEMIEEIESLVDEKKWDKQNRYIKSPKLIDSLQISLGILQILRINGALPYIKIGETIFYVAAEVQEVIDANKIHNS